LELIQYLRYGVGLSPIKNNSYNGFRTNNFHHFSITCKY
jgi:hypothetical protein